MRTFYLDPDVVEAECGYRPFTTFWEDFSIAEGFGRKAVKPIPVLLAAGKATTSMSPNWP